MRAFIAIELPQQIQSLLNDIQEKLRPLGADVKWVNPKNIHLTLKFLGKISDKKIEKIGRILEEVGAIKQPFYIRIGQIGAFPNLNSPKVIWVGIEKGAKQLRLIAESLENALEKLGIAKENRPFSCHITIGRLRSGLNCEKLVKALAEISPKPFEDTAEFPVTKITLFKSCLSSSGPTYSILKEANLTTA